MVEKKKKIGAPINDREEAEGGESGLNLSGGGGGVTLRFFHSPDSITFWERKGTPLSANCE